MESNSPIVLEARVNGPPIFGGEGIFSLPLLVESVDISEDKFRQPPADLDKLREGIWHLERVCYKGLRAYGVVLPLFDGDRVRIHGDEHLVEGTVRWIEALGEQGKVRQGILNFNCFLNILLFFLQ